MTALRGLALGALAVVTAALAWLLFVGLPHWYARYPGPAATRTIAAAPSPAPTAPGRKIKARLYYLGDDGLHLQAIERDVPYGEGTVEQARLIIESQIAPVVDPLVSTVPPGTRLRAVFVTERGEAYVDLSREVSSAHPGGSLEELLTIYTIVDALTTNLPAVTAVQLLVDGKEADTLAGHVDTRRPFAKNLAWVQ
jgi:hypothetical protein